MICIALGLGVLGFLAARKARRCGLHHGWGWHHHHGCGWHGHGRHGSSRRAVLHHALAHIDATPAQERAIVGEIDALDERLRTARTTLRDGRPDLAAAIREPAIDDAALAAVLSRVDRASTEARGALLDAVRNIHAVLDDKQRSELADLIDRRSARPGGGPYRV
jgi:uncharacterized membrane protein